MVCVLIGGIAGLYLSFYSESGWLTGVGFLCLSLLWLLSALQALRYILAGNIEAHRRWMVRNFAMTFAAVSLRLQLPLLASLFGFETAYIITAYSSWMLNLLIAEYCFNRNAHTAGLGPAST